MAEDNIVQKVKRWKPMSKRPIGRPETRWEYIKSINIGNWKKVAQRVEIVGRKWLSKPEPYIGCSALEEDEGEEEEEGEKEEKEEEDEEEEEEEEEEEDLSEERAASMCTVCAVQGERTAKTLNKKAASCFEIPATICLQIRRHIQDDRITINIAVITCSVAVPLAIHCWHTAASQPPTANTTFTLFCCVLIITCGEPTIPLLQADITSERSTEFTASSVV